MISERRIIHVILNVFIVNFEPIQYINTVGTEYYLPY